LDFLLGHPVPVDDVLRFGERFSREKRHREKGGVGRKRARV
jgi:hypothetical protein